MNQGIIKLMQEKMAEKLFFIFCCLMVALLYIRDVGNINLSKWIFLSLAVLVFLLYNINYTAIFVCFLVPLISGIPNSYIFSAGLLILVLKNLARLAINRYILALIMIFTVELASFIYGGFSLGDYLRFIAPLLFISILIFNDRDDLDYGKMLVYFVGAAVGAQILIILQTTSVSGLDSLISSGVRLGNTADLLFEEGMRISFNPNGLGMLCAMTMSILLVLLSQNINPKLKTVIIALLGFELLVGGMGISRSFLILLSIIAVVYWLSLTKSITGFFGGLVRIAVFAVVVFALVNHFVPSVIESYSERISRQDILGGRIEISAAYFNVMSQHPERLFLGVGLQDYPTKCDVWTSSHNGIQEVLVTWGIIGIVLVGLYIFFIAKHGSREVSKNDRKVIHLLPLIVLLVGVQSGQFFSSSVYPMYLLPIYAAMRLAGCNGAIHNSE